MGKGSQVVPPTTLTESEAVDLGKVATIPPPRPLKWFKKPCPICATAGRRNLEAFPLTETTRAKVVVCVCGCVYASEVASEV